MQAWTYLAIAIIFEVGGTLLLKASNGFEKLGYGIAAIMCYSLRFWVFAPVLKIIPAGIAYAIWAGLGIVLVTILSMIIFKQSLNWAQLGCIGLIVIGAAGLHLVTEIS